MYLALFIVNFLLSGIRLFIIPELSMVFHIFISTGCMIGFWLFWEFLLFIGKLLEKRLPMAIHPNQRMFVQMLASYIAIAIIIETVLRASLFIFSIQLPPVLMTLQFLHYFLFSVALNLVYFGAIYLSNWKKNLVSLANLEREQAIAKYEVLSNQLNPHFLFNALTSLNSLIFENQQLASDFLQQLSKVYRYVLQHKENETVSIVTELDFIANYIFLLQTRFTNAIEFDIDLDADSKGKEIVPLTLQILIENAVKHNVVSIATPLKISITNNDSFIIIKNNINKKNQVKFRLRRNNNNNNNNTLKIIHP